MLSKGLRRVDAGSGQHEGMWGAAWDVGNNRDAGQHQGVWWWVKPPKCSKYWFLWAYTTLRPRAQCMIPHKLKAHPATASVGPQPRQRFQNHCMRTHVVD